MNTSSSVTIDRQYGAILEDRWVPAPRYILRRDRILAQLASQPCGKVLEVGCGAGALLREMADQGHQCTGFEAAESAAAIARQMAGTSSQTRIVGKHSREWDSNYDVLIACEVLEHIEDDTTALREWLKWLRPGGLVIISMPAHMKSWSKRDEWAGHLRRYERADMERLACDAGLKVERLECYGFPLSTFTNWLTNHSLRGRGKAGGAQDAGAATAASGTDRSVDLVYFGMQRSLPGRAVMAMACWMQRLFVRSDFGDGYILFGRKA